MKKTSKTIYLMIISFVIAFFCMLAIYAIIGVYPFGDKTLLTMDMSGQYVNYLAYFRNAVFGKANLFYNFSMNLGSNCYGLFAYYLSSPLNILLCFFKESNITEAILLLNIIKIALCSTTMTLLLKRLVSLDNKSILMLSIMYAFMSYNIVYSQNIMWLDACIYLPLVILGIEKILKKEKKTLYIISLFLCIISNFYVGYMVGLFSVMYTIFRLIILNKTKNIRALFKEYKYIIKEYLKATIISLLLSMIILLPVLFNLLNSKADIQTSIFSFNTYYSPLDVFSKMIIGAFNKEQLGFGPPNIFCGSLCLTMFILFFFNSKIDSRERKIYLCFVGIFLLCFVVVLFDLVFHMLQTPVWFPFRNSFLFSFLTIILAAKNMEKIIGIKEGNLFKVQGVSIFLILILHKFGYSYITTKNVILTIIFILLTGILYFGGRKKKIYLTLLLGIVFVEMFFNGYLILKQMDYVERDSFFSKYHYVKDVVSKYKSDNKSFYRIENNISRTINDPMLYNYNGFDHYSSLSGKNNKKFLTNFGIRHSLIPENCSNTTVPMAAVLGVKYYISDKDNDRGVNFDYYDEKEPGVYENRYALNLGFLVSDESKNIQLSENEPLENINELFKQISNENGEIFEEVILDDFVNIDKPIDEEWYIVYNFSGYDIESIKIYIDKMQYKFLSETKEDINNVIYIPKGVENIKVESKCEYNLKAYRYNHSNFEMIYNKINKNQMSILKNNESFIKGTIDVDRDGVLLTSIINDDGWKVKVDGKKVDSYDVAGNLLAIDITKGKHIIEFSYVPSGFPAGCLLFFVGLILFICDMRGIGFLLKK